jgi:8-oxo-dGTP diphosphatase
MTPPNDRNRPLIGVGVIVMRKNRVLLGRRRNAHGAGTWQFPGGHLEFNESIEDCARREVLEETGLGIQNLRRGPYTNDIFPGDGKHYVTLYVLADCDSGEPTLREPDKCDRWGWFSWDDPPRPRFIPLANLLAQGFDPFAGRDRRPATPLKVANIFSEIPEALPEETFEDILKSGRFRLERIVSKGHASPEGFWYDQEHHEWVMVLKGKAGLLMEGVEGVVRLEAGDYLTIPAGAKHRVEWTDPEGTTVWLAIHY